MTHDQYLELKTLYPRRGLYPLELIKLFNLFQQIEGWDAGCNSCAENIRFVFDRLYPKLESYESWLHQEAEKQRLIQEEEQRIKEEKELSNKAKKKK